MDNLIFNLAILQVGLPLLLILAHTFVPSTSQLVLLLRAAALLVLLYFAALAGLWLFPPWWTPYVLMVLLALGTLFRWRRRTTKDRSWWRIAEPALALAVMVAAGLALVPVYAGRNAPAGAIDLAMPLGPGRYLVTSGGAAPVINAHMQMLSLQRAQAYRGQGYAMDIIGIDWLGRRTNGISPTDPKAYFIYDTPVLAPCDGTVAQVTTGFDDMPVPQMDFANMTGNSVMLKCGANHVLLAHLAPGSIRVAQGDTVETGTQLGRVGNTGNTGEPHLHIHVQQGMPPDQPIAGIPQWFTLNGVFYVRNNRFVVDE